MVTFSKIKKWFKEDLNRQGIYNKEAKEKAQELALEDILDGFGDLEEAKEYVKSMKESGNVFFTARGTEINYKILREAIKEKAKA